MEGVILMQFAQILQEVFLVHANQGIQEMDSIV